MAHKLAEIDNNKTSDDFNNDLNEEIPQAGHVLKECISIDVAAKNRMVLSIFNRRPDLVSLPVIDTDSQRPIGLINQSILMSSLAKPFYKEIYLDRSCLSFMDKDPLVVEVGTPLQELSILIAGAGEKVVADGFIIVSDGCYLGVGSVQDVLRVMAEVHQKHSHRLAKHRDDLESLIFERTKDLVSARDAAESAGRAKTSFLANMSHEIRTPMNGILGMTYLMSRDTLSEKQAARLEKIDRSARHLLAIVNDILDLSKINAGQLTLSEEKINLKQIIATVTGMLGQVAQSKGLTLDIDTPENPGIYFGDGTRLTQSLLNYLSNAIKFTEQGSITIRYRAIEENTLGTLIRFEVEDTGIGIPAQTLSELFSPFRQADDSTTRKYGGTGLGLSITRHISQLMGGDANAESWPGKGSLFWFTVRLKRSSDNIEPCILSAPTHQAEATALGMCEQLKIRHGGARILVAEDEPINQEITAEVLTDAGLLVDLANNGQEAVEMAGSAAYDLILMDMQMPKMDGLTATREIRHLLNGKPLPIIAMTANAFDTDQENCIAAGMDDFLSKPCRPDDLYACLLDWLNKAEPKK